VCHDRYDKNPMTKRPQTPSSPTNKSRRTKTMTNWGSYLGASKTGASIDHEAERIDRQKAAFGHDTIARLKDLNVLIVGLGGVGVETAKNLILSNVGGVVLFDGRICREVDRGSNFYVTSEHVGEVTLAQASLRELRSLNPFCRVDVLECEKIEDEVLNGVVLGCGKPFTAIVVTMMLPKQQLFHLNTVARENGIAFIMALTNGVTSSIFSDFGSHHEITDATGEPSQTLAISNVEVLDEKPNLLDVSGVEEGETVVIITVAQNDHGLEDGDVVVLEDMRGKMKGLNGKSVTVKRVAISSPVRLFLLAFSHVHHYILN
jgi:ubiquitin-activating enzyme E1